MGNGIWSMHDRTTEFQAKVNRRATLMTEKQANLWKMITKHKWDNIRDNESITLREIALVLDTIDTTNKSQIESIKSILAQYEFIRDYLEYDSWEDVDLKDILGE